jgi:hypothetical protein
MYSGWSQDRKASIATAYELDEQDFIPLQIIHTGSRAHPASHLMGTGGYFPGMKQPGCEADLSPPTDVKIKNANIHPLPHISSWHSA